MDMIENVTTGVGRGRGSATNVPERALIDQIKERPLLFDKTVKDYRKPGISDSAWNDVATALGASVINCRKRWKSLRDTFIKYYRLEVLYNSGESKRKHKPWIFYRDLAFLKHHVELFRTEESYREGQDASYVKQLKNDDDTSNFRIIEANDSEKEVYEIKITEEDYEEEEEDVYNVKEDHLLETFEDHIESTMEYDILEETEERTEGNFEYYEETDIENEDQGNAVEEVVASPTTLEPPVSVECQKKEVITEDKVTAAATTAKNIIDPDERYLMSCLPAFKRFSTQQKAFVRMGIERLFYEVEFENVSEPKIKRHRMS